MTIFATILYIIWQIVNVLLFTYVVVETVLLIASLIKEKRVNLPQQKEGNLPKVCIQLPVYNEKFVIERLLESVSKIEYPKELLEIQVLDDSNDETSEIIAQYIANNPEVNMLHIQREDRSGFKAGALDYGLKKTDAKFIAIFDADFIPKPDFLKTSLPYFENAQIGVVQSRWAHTNEHFSFLTRAQAIMLNTHFSIEQMGRTKSGAFINFNGTAGIWRKDCIEDAGGWKSDTLTEDLDLSFRAQSRGWKFQYLHNLTSPAELPVTLDAYKTQQFRWSKGAAECIRKNLVPLWKSPASFWAKLAGTFHLFNSSVYIIVLLLIITSPLIFWMRSLGYIDDGKQSFILFASIFTSCALPFIFLVGHIRAKSIKPLQVILFPVQFYLFLAISTGISLYMVLGVIQGYLGNQSPFIRTPKFNLSSEKKSVDSNEYTSKKEVNIKGIEYALLLYAIFVFVLGVLYMNIFIFMYSILMIIGFSLKLFAAQKVFKF